MNSIFLRRLGLPLMMMTLLVACTSGPKARVDQDSHVNFAAYKTFAWLNPKSATDEPVAGSVTLEGQRARSALAATLQAKGYALDEAHPDVRISYVFNLYERPKQSGMRIGIGAGGGSGNVAGGVGVSLPVGKRNETVAALTVNVSAASSNEQIWVGSSEVILKSNVATDADVNTLAEKILAKYPARAP